MVYLFGPNKPKEGLVMSETSGRMLTPSFFPVQSPDLVIVVALLCSVKTTYTTVQKYIYGMMQRFLNLKSIT